ncbi:MAG: hypothetical protein CMM07_25685 [Rhodopirellula sp.]|nr:hypothetical protein [Rhodopirellula sp.]
MTDQTPKPRTRSPITPLEFSKPFYMTIDQSDSTNNTSFFQGPKAKEAAEEHAGQRAARLGRPVAVLGPQYSVKVKPAAVQADDMPLAFIEG